MKKILILVLSLLAGVPELLAQSQTTVSYSIGFGTGDLGDFISKPSFRGIAFDYRKLVKPNIGVGFTLGWNVFYEEKAYDTYVLDNRALSGKQFRYSNQFPLLLASNYYLKPGQALNPYVGIGIGTMYSLRNTDMNLYTLQQEAWHFSLTPEVGLQYSVNDSAEILIGVKYITGLKAGDFDAAQNYLALNVGLVLSR